jgi:hypothetical protein
LISLGPSLALALRAPLRGVQIGCPADLSNQALSTTQTPLHIFSLQSSYTYTSISAAAAHSATLFINLPFELYKLSHCSRRSNADRDTSRNTLTLKSG